MAVGIVQFLTSCNIVKRRVNDARRYIVGIYIIHLLKVFTTSITLYQILVMVSFCCCPNSRFLNGQISVERRTKFKDIHLSSILNENLVNSCSFGCLYERLLYLRNCNIFNYDITIPQESAFSIVTLLGLHYRTCQFDEL